eukprot:TRINITY_DN413_c0_g1_i1.p1 TRINITY_DN413_c0_g1~~TRINITY_DN413_c0_g1_i1.p1  ORF type:complete len:371 (+),score=68.54 TRINITY_DN413_c0_g1_i1:189-1301(+)
MKKVLCFFAVCFISLFVVGSKSEGGVYSYDLKPTIHAISFQGYWAYGVEFTIDSEIGTPSQSIPLLADSGSVAVLVYSTECETEGCVDRTKFSSCNSETWVDLNIPYIEKQPAMTKNLIPYYNNMSGVYGEDVFTFSDDAEFDFMFALLNSSSWSEPGLNGYNFSGVCGLSLNDDQTRNVSYLYNAYQAGMLQNDMYGFLAPKSGSGLGEITLGGYNPELIDGEITWHDVLTDKNIGQLFLLNLTDIQVDGESLMCDCSEQDCLSLIDTGAAILTVAGPNMPALNVLPDCSNIEQLPVVSIFMDDVEYTISPFDYVFKVYNMSTHSYNCQSNALGIAYSQCLVDVGGWFFSKYYTIFDRENTRVGFANAA